MVLKLEPTQVDCSELEIIRSELGILVTELRDFISRLRDPDLAEFYNGLGPLVIAEILEETIDG